MIKIKALLAFSILIALPATAEKEYVVQAGDSLKTILNNEGFDGTYTEIYEQIDEVRKLNSERFSERTLDLIYPNEVITIPTVFIEPEPEPEPETTPTPVPAAIPEPLYVGSAKRGNSRATLLRNDVSELIDSEIGVLIKDRLKTDKMGQAKILLNDSSTYVIGPNSEFLIEDFSFQPSLTQRFVAKLNLLVGVISIKTGKIGKKSEDLYELKTPAVALSVRGTEYTVRYCEGVSCGDLLGATAAVKQGSIVVHTQSGPVDVPKGKFVQVEAPNSEAKVGDIPDGFFDLKLKPEDIKKSWFQKAVETASEYLNI